MHRSLSILLLLVLACGSTQATRPAGVAQPDLNARLINPLFFGSGTEAHATIEVDVQNRANVPIIVRRIELDSPGMAQYSLRRSVRDYRETIPPGQTKSLTTFATAVAQTTRQPTEPLMMRVMVEFEAADGKVWREILMLRN
jgi:hypothetical protein